MFEFNIFIALQDRSKGIIFNGDQNENKYGGHYEISGSIVEYKKLDVLAEQLLAKGPLTQELKVLVGLCRSSFFSKWSVFL